MDRLDFFQGPVLMSKGALLGCESPSFAQEKVKIPFDKALSCFLAISFTLVRQRM